MQDIALIELVLKRCGEVGLTPFLWGKHGIGKSQITRAVYEALGYKVRDLRLGQMEVGDLIGHPASLYYCPKCGTEYGFAARFTNCPMCEQDGATIPIAGKMVWLPPSWFPQPGEKVALFFDEFNRGREDVQQAAFQIVLDRRIHTHEIPDDCPIICAGNPPSSDAGTGQDYNVTELDPALMNRFVHIKYVTSTDNWLKWARKHGIDQNIVDFIAIEESFLGNESIDIPIEILPTPRGYEFLSLLISDKVKKGTPIPRKHWLDVAEMVIGSAAATSFWQSLKTEIDKPIKAREIFDGFDKVKDRILEQVEAGDGTTRFDLLRITLDEIGQCLSEETSHDYNDKQLNNAADFFVMLPQDLAFDVLKELSNNNDINERLLLARDDLFAILRDARKNDIG